MAAPEFTRHGTWWVTTPDGRRIQRTARDFLTYREGERVFHLPVEIGDIGTIIVFQDTPFRPSTAER